MCMLFFWLNKRPSPWITIQSALPCLTHCAPFDTYFLPTGYLLPGSRPSGSKPALAHSITGSRPSTLLNAYMGWRHHVSRRLWWLSGLHSWEEPEKRPGGGPQPDADEATTICGAVTGPRGGGGGGGGGGSNSRTPPTNSPHLNSGSLGGKSTVGVSRASPNAGWLGE